MTVVPKRHQTYVIESVFLEVLQTIREPVWDYEDRAIAELSVDWFHRGVEKQVSVQIGHDINPGVVLQYVQWERWRAGEVVLDRRAILLSLYETMIAALEVFEANGNDRG